MKRSPAPTIIGVIVLWALSVALTILSFYTLVAPENQDRTFHTVMGTICFAESVLFAYVGYMLAIPQAVTRASPAVRMRIFVLVVIWFVLILILGIVAVHPLMTDTFYSDNLFVFQAMLTLLLLIGCVAFHRQDVMIQMLREGPEDERVQLKSFVCGVEARIESVRSLLGRYERHDVDIDRLIKRLDTVKTQLLSVLPQAERAMGRGVQPIAMETIERPLTDLHDAVENLLVADAEETFTKEFDKVCAIVEKLVEALGHRDDVLTF